MPIAWSPIRMRPERSGPSLGATEYARPPEPVPAPSVIVIHVSLVEADHWQLAAAVTENLPPPPFAENDAVAGVTDSGHDRSGAACLISMARSPMRMRPVRSGPSLGRTE